MQASACQIRDVLRSVKRVLTPFVFYQLAA
jgi:hypothetical protein